MDDRSTNPPRIDRVGRDLRTECEHEVLRGVVRRLKQDDLSPEQFCKLVQAYCELKKHDVADEKNRAVLELARARAAAKRTTPTLTDAAPFGRKDDGSPYTQREFQTVLARSVSDIYGLSCSDEASTNRPRTEPRSSVPDRDGPDPEARPAPARPTPAQSSAHSAQAALADAPSRDPP